MISSNPRIKAILVVFFSTLSLLVNAQWKQDQFVLGTFYDPQIKDCKLDTANYIQILKGVKACNLNLLTGVDGCYDFNFVAYKLSLLSKLGLQTLQLNLASSQKANVNFSAAKAGDWFSFASKLSADQRKAFYGYFVYDEPWARDVAVVKKWVSYFKTKDPNKLAYVNLAPCYVFKTREQYEEYLDSYLTSSNPSERLDVVSYDFYPFIQNGIKTDYFYNLSVLRKKSAGRPLWACVLTTKHREYTDIGPYELNFMMFAPLTYGFKGLVYFTYQTVVGSTMPFGPAMILNNKPTDKYYRIQKANAFIRDVWGPLVMNAQSVGVYQVSSKPYNQQPMDDELITPQTPVISKLGNDNLAAGIFKSQATPQEYNLMLFNKSSATLKSIPITVKGNYLNKAKVAISYMKYVPGNNAFSKLTGTYDNKSNTTTLLIDFAPGEGRVLKLSGVTNN